NVGTCTWTSAYHLVFDSGNQMGAPDSQQLTTGTVEPGQQIDVSVNLVAPDDPGKYRGNYKLQNANGIVFGIDQSSKPFWVEIRVPDESGVRFDFLSQAKNADWGSGVEPVDFANPGHQDIAYGGPDTNEIGFVMIKDAVKLENRQTSGKILQTHPKWVDNGYIIGRYPAYKVGPGDYIKGQLGFIALPDGTCGAGEVVYEIHYTIDGDLGTRTRLGRWPKECDGRLLSIELSLADLKGENVDFYLVVLADGPFAQDWAIWSSLGVMR
ncbi:MAG: NBR1-Ig-like domain-containing protein, partial [Anaerolineales bacterium]